MINRIIKHLRYLWIRSSSEHYLDYLRKNGATIGENVNLLSVRHCSLDERRAPFIRIGSNVTICAGVTLLAHDYSWSVLKEAFNEIVPSGGGEVSIGNNVFLGVNSTILRNVHIGNNCIIGACSLVSHDIPDNSVAAGNPAKVIMRLEDFLAKRKELLLEDVKQTARVIRKVAGRPPTENEMAGFRILFMPRNEENLNKLLQENVLGGKPERVYEIYKSTPPQFQSYEQMVEELHL